jgi:hypothetical protein
MQENNSALVTLKKQKGMKGNHWKRSRSRKVSQTNEFEGRGLWDTFSLRSLLDCKTVGLSLWFRSRRKQYSSSPGRRTTRDKMRKRDKSREKSRERTSQKRSGFRFLPQEYLLSKTKEWLTWERKKNWKDVVVTWFARERERERESNFLLQRFPSSTKGMYSLAADSRDSFLL